jgi:hypothetical protein
MRRPEYAGELARAPPVEVDNAGDVDQVLGL